jgi:hypothetical protein
LIATKEIEGVVYCDQKVLRYLDIDASNKETKHSISYLTMMLHVHQEL